jgi:hypothetical protein
MTSMGVGLPELREPEPFRSVEASADGVPEAAS